MTSFRSAARAILRRPGFAILYSSTLAFGIAGSVTAFSAVDRLLLSGPGGVDDAEAVQRVYVTTPTEAGENRTSSGLGYVALTTLREAVPEAPFAAYTSSSAPVGSGLGIVDAISGGATANFFPMLGIEPVVGRLFSVEEDRPGAAAKVVVLSESFAIAWFGGGQAALGESLLIRNEPFAVIGVLPRGVTGAELTPVDVWMPLSAWPPPTPDWPTTWRAQWLQIVTRLPDGLSADAVGAAATIAFREAYDGTNPGGRVATLSLGPLRFTGGGVEPEETTVALWLVAIAFIVLIIACANIANLTLIRSLDRYREVALRSALGIRTAGLIRLLLAESLVLAALGGVLGAGLAAIGVTLVRRVFLAELAWDGPLIDVRSGVVAIVLTAGVGLLMGLVPLAHLRQVPLAGTLRGSAEVGSSRGSGARTALLAVQAALTVPLLVGAGLFAQSLRAIDALDLGIEPEGVLVVAPQYPRLAGLSQEAADQERARRGENLREVASLLASRPDVESASVAVGLPFGFSFGVALAVPGLDSLPALPGGGPFISAVGPDYFGTVGTSMIGGRAFALTDNALSERVAIVNASMARALWPAESALGKCLVIGGPESPCATVVGVAEDAKQSGLRDEPSMQYYVPLGQERGFGGPVLLIRPSGDDIASAAEPLRLAAAPLIPTATRLTVSRLQDAIDPQMRPWRLGAGMFGLFATLATLVAAVGLYSALAYAAARRQREMAIRRALGAPAGEIARRIIGGAAAAVGVGSGFGVLAAVLASDRIQPLLFDNPARDPAVYGMTLLLMMTITLLAAAVPARRGLRLDARSVLRGE